MKKLEKSAPPSIEYTKSTSSESLLRMFLSHSKNDWQFIGGELVLRKDSKIFRVHPYLDIIPEMSEDPEFEDSPFEEITETLHFLGIQVVCVNELTGFTLEKTFSITMVLNDLFSVEVDSDFIPQNTLSFEDYGRISLHISKDVDKWVTFLVSSKSNQTSGRKRPIFKSKGKLWKNSSIRGKVVRSFSQK